MKKEFLILEEAAALVRQPHVITIKRNDIFSLLIIFFVNELQFLLE